MVDNHITAEPVIAEWLEAYCKWLPDAIANGHMEVNDAFRAGFLLGFKAGNDYAFPGETDAR